MQEALSTTSANPKINTPYPHIALDCLTDALTVVIDSLENGDLPLLVTYQGETYRVADIDKSPLNIAKLLKITQITLWRNASEKVLIRDNYDLLEAGVI